MAGLLAIFAEFERETLRERVKAGIAQHPTLRHLPVREFFQVLERIPGLEPGIEHAMRKDEIGNLQIPQRPPGAETAVLPDSVENDCAELLCMGMHPGGEAPIVPVASRRRAKRVDRRRKILQIRFRWIIQGDHIDAVPLVQQLDAALPDDLDGTS